MRIIPIVLAALAGSMTLCLVPARVDAQVSERHRHV